MHGAHVSQGKKGTGDDKTPIGIRCPPEIYQWLSAGRLARETDTGMVLRALEQLMEMEQAAGARLPEIRVAALLEKESFGKMVAKLALEALDSRRKGKK